MTSTISRKRLVGRKGLAVACAAALAAGVPVLAGAEPVALVDSFELAEGTDLTGWTLHIVERLARPAGSLTGPTTPLRADPWWRVFCSRKG